MSIAVVTDSTSDMPKLMADENQITLVPALVRFGETEYRDGVDITGDGFYSRLERDKDIFPTTSQPTAGQFKEVFQGLLEENDQIVSVHISSKVSGTYASALEGARNADPSGERIISIDSGTASMCTAWFALAIKGVIDRGGSVQDAVQQSEQLVSRTFFAGNPNTLEYLKRGGRMGTVRSKMATLMRVKPVLGFIDGVVEPIYLARSYKKGIGKLRELVGEKAPVQNLAVMYSTDTEDAEALLAELKPLVAPDGIAMTTQIGPAVGAHLGPGCVAIGFSW